MPAGLVRGSGLEELLRDAKKRAFWEPVFRGFVNAIYDVRCVGLGNVDAVKSSGRPFIVAPSHGCFFDGFIVGSLIPGLDFVLAKEECWLNPLYRYFIPDVGGIPAVRRGRLDVLRTRYGAGTIFDTYDQYITPGRRFRFEKYLPAGRVSEILDDVKRVVGVVRDPKSGIHRGIDGLDDICLVVLAQYVLLNGRNLLLFPQGTRKRTDPDGVEYGLYNIVRDLAVFHDKVIPVIPASISYRKGWFYQSIAMVSFGEPRDVLSYLDPQQSQPHRLFMGDLMADIRMLSEDR